MQIGGESSALSCPGHLRFFDASLDSFSVFVRTLLVFTLVVGVVPIARRILWYPAMAVGLVGCALLCRSIDLPAITITNCLYECDVLGAIHGMRAGWVSHPRALHRPLRERAAPHHGP